MTRSIAERHESVKGIVRRMEEAHKLEQEARAAVRLPSDKDALESATIRRRNTYHELLREVNGLIVAGV